MPNSAPAIKNLNLVPESAAASPAAANRSGQHSHSSNSVSVVQLTIHDLQPEQPHHTPPHSTTTINVPLTV